VKARPIALRTRWHRALIPRALGSTMAGDDLLTPRGRVLPNVGATLVVALSFTIAFVIVVIRQGRVNLRSRELRVLLLD
jgi:hypothetical protein